MGIMNVEAEYTNFISKSLLTQPQWGSENTDKYDTVFSVVYCTGVKGPNSEILIKDPIVRSLSFLPGFVDS